jgi:uncharacterized protein DUF2721
MALPSVTELIPVLQVAVGPVILISGVGLVLLSMTNRLGRAIDRARSLKQKLDTQTEAERAGTWAQLKILSGRGRLLRQAITFASLSILLAALLIMSLFLAALFKMEVGWVILLLFIGCLASLIASMLLFIHDLNQALAALQLELGEAGGVGKAGSDRA